MKENGIHNRAQDVPAGQASRAAAYPTVAIIGGGLAGLYMAKILHAAGVGILLLEARDRLGGRIRITYEAGQASQDGFDLGASWVWPEARPAVAAPVNELGSP